MAKKRKTSMAVAPKCARIEAILVQPTVEGSSRAANAPRKEMSVPTKAVMSIRSVVPTESVPRPSTSSSKRSFSGPKISIRMSDRRPDVSESIFSVEVPLDTKDKRKGIGDYRVTHSLLKSVILPTDIQTFEEVEGAFRIQDSYDSLLRLIHHIDYFVEVIREVRHLSKEAEEKAVQANRRVDDAQLSWLKVEDEIRSLRERMKQLKSELAKAKAQMLGERKAGKAWAKVARVEVVEAFRALKEFCNIKIDFASLSYLQEGIDLKEKVQRIFSDLDLNLLELDDEVAEEVEGQKIQRKDIFSPMHDDLTAKDVASVPPPAVITLSNQAKVSESRALDRA
ncbi:hypothetical protein COCNU_06G016920 [Cocos nucifera]|uniref:Uncharacterized protein n=1 Tax=Cocos nucifera TaxID=13894 RepID=A0A8K0ICN1_COCNU|nr:hypothetical protein COCNU_06G016920 [Cocos nucifera]